MSKHWISRQATARFTFGRTGAFTWLVTLLVLLTAASGTLGWMPAASSGTHVSGIAIVGQANSKSAVPSVALAQAWSDALLLANGGNDLGYPWADATTGELVLSIATDAGNLRAQQWIVSGAEFRAAKVISLAKPQVRVRTRPAQFGFAALETIKHSATRLVEARVPDADAIYQTEPDWENNRVIITIARPSDRLLADLATRYGTQAIAVRIAPKRPTMPGAGSRTADASAFYGGAVISAAIGCSSGFSWTDSITDYMLTGAHCAPGGAQVTTPADVMGFITSGSRENWTTGTGTVLFTGDNVYRGDVALVQMWSSPPKFSSAFMYSGAAGDPNSATIVREMWSRSPLQFDQYCTGGSVTYALCGWVVQNALIDHQYDNGEWVRNATVGTKTSGNCANLGDSGGPVYTVRGDGTIAAKGIHSGGTVGGTGNSFFPCLEVFTDIRTAFIYFPGWLRTA